MLSAPAAPRQAQTLSRRVEVCNDPKRKMLEQWRPTAFRARKLVRREAGTPQGNQPPEG